MVPGHGLEPRFPQSKCGVLPLDEPGMADRAGIEPASPVLETGASPLNAFSPWSAGLDSNHPHNGARLQAPSLRAGPSGFPCWWWISEDSNLARLRIWVTARLRNPMRFTDPIWSGWKVSNLRSPAPKAGALPTKLHPDIRGSAHDYPSPISWCGARSLLALSVHERSHI